MFLDRTTLRTIRSRRAALRAEFDVRRQFREIEESCVPSYCHANLLAAAVSWWRLLATRALYRRFGSPGPILDFGAATGELLHLLRPAEPYHFVEADDRLAAALARWAPGARRERLDRLPARRFGTIFALDSLEHNEDVAALVDALLPALGPAGTLIVSGPTENALYRLGRRIAGFPAHYHLTTIREIEGILGRRLRRLAGRRVPLGIPLFRVSAWRRPGE